MLGIQAKLQSMDGDAFATMMDATGHDPTIAEVKQALHALIATDPLRFLGEDNA
jgi:hypothetical protein